MIKCTYMSVIFGGVIFLLILSLHYASRFFFGVIQNISTINLDTQTIAKVLIYVPFSETLMLQFIPFVLGRILNFHVYISITLSILAFSIMHYEFGVLAFFINGILGGALLALWFSYWLSYSMMQATVGTMLAHAIHNGLTIGMVITS